MWGKVVFCIIIALWIVTASCNTLMGSHDEDSCNIDDQACNENHHIINGLGDIISSIELSTVLSGDVKVEKLKKNLKVMIQNLQSKKVRTAVVGITNSGKSTFINALLGKMYLPSSIQPQTARELVLIHNVSCPSGILYALNTNMTNHDGSVSPNGPVIDDSASILEYLRKINDHSRGVINDSTTASYDKLILHAPFIFLNGTENTLLEISDTPGLSEAKTSATVVSEVILKDLSAFILILNLRFLKSESELEAFQVIAQNHKDILSKLNRILILVNSYDDVFVYDNPNNVAAETIPEYVSDYLADPHMLNVRIPPENIIPFSALSALNARVWSADPYAFIASPNAINLYLDARILLINAGYEENSLPSKELSIKNVVSLCVNLLEFSNIRKVEKIIVDMLHTNAPAVLKEAASDDSLVIFEELISIMLAKIESEQINLKESEVTLMEGLLTKFNNKVSLFDESLSHLPSTLFNSVKAQISSITNIQDAINGQIRHQLSIAFQNFKRNNQNEVVAKIQEFRHSATSIAQKEREKSWNDVSKVIRPELNGQMQALLDKLKDGITSLKDFSVTADEEASLSILSKLNLVNVDKWIPSLSSVNTQVDISGINFGKTTVQNEVRYKKVEKEKKKKCGFLKLSRCKKKYTTDEPYNVPVFMPDIPAIQGAFDSHYVSPFTSKYQSSVNNVVTDSAVSLRNTAQREVNAILSSTRQVIQDGLNNSKEKRDTSHGIVANLNHLINNIKATMKNLSKQ